MKINAVRNSGLALVGLAALTIYILACTSFSPDDKKVLYPAFDPLSGAVGVAEYDRETARSRMLFVPHVYSETNATVTPLLRAQWLGNGRRILVSWAVEPDEDVLNLAVVPVSGESAVRLFAFPQEDAGQGMMMPVAVVGQDAFLRGEKQLLKLNLSTGAMILHDLPEADGEFNIYPGFGDQTLFYVAEENDSKEHRFGRLDPKTFARTPLITFTNAPSEGTFFTYNEDGSRLAFAEDSGRGQQLVVLQSGKPPIFKKIADEREITYGNAVLMERKGLLVASYMREGEKTSSFGLLEIPLKDGPVRDTVLIQSSKVKDEMAAFYFQVGVSHDGKTAAVSSMYVACGDPELKPDDCALFLVDLGDPKRTVTRVPIPLPSKRPASPVK